MKCRQPTAFLPCVLLDAEEGVHTVLQPSLVVKQLRLGKLALQIERELRQAVVDAIAQAFVAHRTAFHALSFRIPEVGID